MSIEREPGMGAVGFDVGGTKTNVLNSQGDEMRRYNSAEFANPYEVIDRYLSEAERRPAVLCLGIAAVRNSKDGSVKFAQLDWPRFIPAEAEDHYGFQVVTANDLITTAAGIFEGDNVEVQQIKSGDPSENDPTLVYSWSTGIGSALVVPTERGAEYLPSAVGHAGLAPQYENEIDYLKFVSRRHLGKLSIEFAVGGKVGLDNLVDYYLEKETDAMLELYAQVTRGRASKTPTGQVLIDAATDDANPAQAMAHKILSSLGGLMGYTLRNQVLAVQVGDIRMTGSITHSLLPYLAEKTSFIERFVDKGARCDYIPEAIEIGIVKDPNVAVKGSLILAEKKLVRP
jgi:glucokinase